MKRLLHVLTDLAVLFCMLGLPFLSSDYFRALRSGNADAVSGASVIIEQPSGSYVVLLNTEKHTDTDNLALWEAFFTGTDTPVIFEDISCLTAQSDAGGRTMADSFRSRLPENQMTVHAIDGTLLASKIDSGLFDTEILSAELAQVYQTETAYDNAFVKVLYISGDTE